MSIRLGQLPYISVLPIIWPHLSGKVDLGPFVVVTHEQHTLDQMMNKWELDCAPISTVEYLSNKHIYTRIPNMVLSCYGRIGSLKLVLRQSLSEVAMGTVALPEHSTSTNILVQSMLTEIFGITPHYNYVPDTAHRLDEYDAVLMVGDAALKYQEKRTVLDLGDLWWQTYNTPLVHTVWAIRKTTTIEQAESIMLHFEKMRAIARDSRQEVIEFAAKRLALSFDEIDAFFQRMVYDFTPAHEKSLQQFESLMTAYEAQ
jgi:chorismate dehydratase